jgi:hypothetical protein
MSAIMLILVVLNIYWFILLINMGLKLVFKGKPVDTQNVLKLNKDIVVE